MHNRSLKTCYMLLPSRDIFLSQEIFSRNCEHARLAEASRLDQRSFLLRFVKKHCQKLLMRNTVVQQIADYCPFCNLDDYNQLYEQIDGVAVGSPLGPAFANIFICALEKKFLSNCPSDFKTLLYCRYVDDTFCIFENNSQAQCFLQYLNCQHPNISFTHESEDSSSLPFLVVMVIHSDNTFSTNLYRKKTFTGLYTNFDSLSPIQYKINLISVLIYRAYHICSSYLSLHEQVCSIKRFLQQNQFPIYLINRIIKNFLDRQYSTINKLQNVPKLPVLVLLPYLGVYSVRLKKNLNQFLGKIYPHIEFKFVFQPAKRIGSFFHFKDRAPSHVRSSVVYKFSCSSCKVTYYGKTSRHFIVRCREHLGVNKKGKVSKALPRPSETIFLTLVIALRLMIFVLLTLLVTSSIYLFTRTCLSSEIGPRLTSKTPR